MADMVKAGKKAWKTRRANAAKQSQRGQKAANARWATAK